MAIKFGVHEPRSILSIVFTLKAFEFKTYGHGCLLAFHAAQRLAACPGVFCRGTRGWAGQGNATLTEPTSSRANSLKTRRLPPVGCIIPMQFQDALLGRLLGKYNQRERN